MSDANCYEIGRIWVGPIWWIILWRKEFADACTLLNLDDIRLHGLTF